MDIFSEPVNIIIDLLYPLIYNYYTSKIKER